MDDKELLLNRIAQITRSYEEAIIGLQGQITSLQRRIQDLEVENKNLRETAWQAESTDVVGEPDSSE